MGNEFNANDIFEIAKQIEINGAKFYRDAADQVDGDGHKQFLTELAEMEDSHEQIFADMQKNLSEDETKALTFDPDDENALYLKALADTRVFFEKEAPGADMKKILTSAIAAEKDSIVFYLGIEEMVAQNAGKSKVDDIIKEEMGHIKLLAEKLVEL